MIISDLNHLESISQTVEVTGGSLRVEFLNNASVKVFEQNTQTINGKEVETVQGIFKADGQTFAFSAISVSSPAPL